MFQVWRKKIKIKIWWCSFFSRENLVCQALWGPMGFLDCLDHGEKRLDISWIPGYFLNPPEAQGENERNGRVNLGMSQHSWNLLALLKAKHFQRKSLPSCFARSRNLGRMSALGSEFLRILCFPCREWQELAFLALLAPRGKKESRWVGNLIVKFALKPSQSVQNLQFLGFPWNPAVPHGKGERIKDLGLKIRAFTVSSVVFREWWDLQEHQDQRWVLKSEFPGLEFTFQGNNESPS